MRNTWNRIENWLVTNAPEMIDDLLPGASDQEIHQAERSLGIQFPNDVKESYKIHNGQNESTDNLVLGHRLLSLTEIVRVWKVWKDLSDRNEIYWNSKWVPLISDGAGNEYSLDLSSVDISNDGQIIFIDHECNLEETEAINVIADSFQALMAKFADDLDSGIYTFFEDSGIIPTDENLQ